MVRGRKQEFNELEALDSMMRVFWEKGYEGASYEDLVKGTGVSRAGLYKCFGDKRNAFLHSLNYYINTVIKSFTYSMRQEDAGLQEIKSYFNSVADAMINKGIHGCLIINCMSEKITDLTPEIRVKIQSMIKIIEESFTNALTNAKTRNEINKDVDIKSAVNHLVGTAIGASTMGRGPVDKQTIKDFLSISMGRFNK